MAEDVYRIVDEPIAPDALHALLLDKSDGAVATFAGVVRDHSLDRKTQYLVYDAYNEMAEKKMREIGEQIKGRWDVNRVGMLHRLGRLEIGEISVLIAVSAPHRRAALEACDFGIERLKKEVPIWKKEVWTDGEAWIEGDPSTSKEKSQEA